MALNRWYMGKPAQMFQVPFPARGISQGIDRTGNGNSLQSASSSMQNGRRTKRIWNQLQWQNRNSDALDLLAQLFDGVLGPTPAGLVTIEPTWRNFLPRDVANFGSGFALPASIVPTGGSAIAQAPTVAPPSGGSLPLSEVAAWTGIAAGSTLAMNALTDTSVDQFAGAVLLQAEPMCASIYLRASAGVSLRLLDSTGAAVVSTVSVTASVTAAWQRFSVPVTAGSAPTGVFAMPRLSSTAAFGGTVWMTAAQLEHDTAPSTWQKGWGTPRTFFTASPELSMDMPAYRTLGGALQEIV